MSDLHPYRAALGAIGAAVLTMAVLYASYLAIGYFAGAAATSSQYFSPYIIGPLNLLLPILAGSLWYRSTAQRVMAHGERLVFAIGVVLISTLITIIILYASAIMAGLPLDWLLSWTMLQFIVLHLMLAYGLSWLVTLRPRNRSPGS